MLDLISKRYGAIEVQQGLTINALVTTIQETTHSLDRPDQAYSGLLLMRPQNGDTYLVWQAAPNAWFQAVSAVIAPQMLVAIQPN